MLKMQESKPHSGDVIANGDTWLMVITSAVSDQTDGLALRDYGLLCFYCKYRTSLMMSLNNEKSFADSLILPELPR
ncbi:carbamoyl-phosphate synthase large chain [Spatholobus suberectus]|nr:carbamoyl-phosphate synthase large chain [Spatholobus suberectus]